MPDLFSISAWREFTTKHGTKFMWTMIIVFGASLILTYGAGNLGRMMQNTRNTNGDAPIATINGRPVLMRSYQLVARRARGAAGEQTAEQQGQALQALVIQEVLAQEAEKRHLHADDALVDKTLNDERENVVGKNVSEEQWRSYVSQVYDMNLNQYREYVAHQLLGAAVAEDYKKDIKVTEEEAKNQSAEVKLRFMLIRNLDRSMVPPNPKMARPLPEPEAKKRAEELQAKIKAGADFASLAKQYSGDMASQSKGGDLEWKKEYAVMSGRGDALGYGDEFDAAVHKTAKGGITDVIHVKGFLPGYAFAQVVDRRNTLPKDFDAKKVIESLKTARAQEKFKEEMGVLVDSAKVEVSDPEIRAYYGFFQYKQAEQKQMFAQFSAMQGTKNTGKIPTQDDVKKMLAGVEQDFEALYKTKQDDATVNIVLGNLLKLKRFAPGTTPQQRDQIRDRLITLYETGLKGTEDTAIRRELADFYKEKKNFEKAAEHYKMVSRLSMANPPTDANAAQSAISDHEVLETNFKAINKPDLAAEEHKIKNELIKLQLDLKMKEAAESKAKAAATTPQMPIQATIPPASKSAPTGANTPPGAVNSTASKPAPTGATTTPQKR